MGGKGRRHDGKLRSSLRQLINEAVQRGARLKAACDILGISIRTLQRWQAKPIDERKGPNRRPAHALTKEEKDRIVALVNSPTYRDLSAEQAVAKLADGGTYVCSERSLRRVLAERKLNTYRERSKPAQGHNKSRQHVASEPLRLLSWDITYLRDATLRGNYFYLYLYLDVWSRRIVGWEVHEHQDSELAAKLLQSLCNEHSLETEKVIVHSDNGAPMKGSTMLAMMQSLGITASFSRPGVSDDNAFVESLFRHLKYAPAYPAKGFLSLVEAQDWVNRFIGWYNTQHLHSSIGYVTPEDRHHGRDIAILANRREVYAKAHALNPSRWSRSTRAWHRPANVTLNPDRLVLIAPSTKAKAA